MISSWKQMTKEIYDFQKLVVAYFEMSGICLGLFR